LRAQLNLLLGALLFVSLLVNIAWIAWEAGPRIRAEDQSDERLARQVISTVLVSLQDAPNPAPRLMRLIGDLQNLRHVRIFFAANEAEAEVMPQFTYSNSANQPPQWFIDLFTPRPRFLVIPADFNGKNLGVVAIASDPTQELSEIWTEMGTVVATAFLFGVCLLIFIMVLVGRAIAPIAQVGQAISQLAAGDTSVKLVPRGPPEFIDISEKLNGLAVDLAKVNAENTRLVQQIMKVQEEERAQIARDLHDDMGPHLFCIRANVSALREKLPDDVGKALVAIGEQAESIQTLLRRLLQRLRPAGLGELGLSEALRTLVGSWRAAHPEIEVSLKTSDDFAAIDENISLAVYRVVQEGLTNVFRHAGASHAEVSVDWATSDWDSGEEAKRGLRVRVEDDGIGVPERFERGLGLTGMYERVRACGGHLKIAPCGGGGTCIEAVLPLNPVSASILESA
jgi:two-component system, NarL family, sensor histidine kinase UhpB